MRHKSIESVYRFFVFDEFRRQRYACKSEKRKRFFFQVSRAIFESYKNTVVSKSELTPCMGLYQRA